MIDGERGDAIVEQIVVLKSAAVMDGDSVTTSLIGAVLTQALRQGDTPRAVALALWDALPADDDWEPVMREKFEEAVDQLEARGL